MAKEYDLTRGWYRRQYGKYPRGIRINAVSLEAEAWFWRIHTVATDDFGNADRDADLCFAATVGKRKGVTAEQIEAWLVEMERAGLVGTYEVSGERYLHVHGFIVLQSTRNGKQTRRFPKSPWDDKEAAQKAGLQEKCDPDESRIIQIDPAANENENEIKNENKIKNYERDPVVAVLVGEGFKADDPLLSDPNCTLEQVEVAIANANALPPGKLTDRRGFIAQAIRKGYKLSAKASKAIEANQRRKKQAEHATKEANDAAKRARDEKIAAETVTALPDEAFQQLVTRVYEENPEVDRRYVKPVRSNPWVQLKVYELLRKEQAHDRACA
jgi:hypothetical protein